MSKRISATVSDATYDAILTQARQDGQAAMRDSGKGYVIRKSLRAWLNHNRYSVALLDMNDESYAEYLTEHPEGLPHARKHITPAISE